MDHRSLVLGKRDSEKPGFGDLHKLTSTVASVNPSNLSHALIPYAEARNELRLSRYRCDKLIKNGRLRTVVAGRNLFIPADDIVSFQRELRERELADRARRAVPSLPWYDACRLHRLPLPIAMNRRVRHVFCTQHCYRAVFSFMGRRCPVERAAEIGIKLRLTRNDDERCEQCARHGPVPESETLDYLREGVYLSQVDGNRSRRMCAQHFLDILYTNAEDDIHGVIGLGLPGTHFAAESMMRLLEYCHVGEPHEVCVVCVRAAGVLPIGRGVASGAVRYELF